MAEGGHGQKQNDADGQAENGNAVALFISLEVFQPQLRREAEQPSCQAGGFYPARRQLYILGLADGGDGRQPPCAQRRDKCGRKDGQQRQHHRGNQPLR